jgi:serine/threonine protein kinase
MTACSSDMMLARMLNEQLDEVAHASIVDHVESCVHCQERLKDLTSDCSRIVDREQLNRSSTDPWLTGNAPGSGSTADQCMISPFLLPSPRGPALRSLADDERFTRATYEGRRARGPILDVDLPAVEGYEIIAELGHGGMGVVYKARHQSLGRFVALKMIRAGSLAKPEDLARFRIEAEAVAKQRHPNIIQIYDIGETGGLPFVALELLEGGSLEDFLAATPQPGEFSARLSATLARAVHTAHQAGIIHRDLKPSNVMFASEGTPKITDFGLAKRLEEDGYTETGQVLGSPSYIPPEQAQGLAKEVGPAADVYSLGAILYEMLTGRPPFKGTTPVETVMQVLNEDPVPPSQLQPHVPRDLETICLKCLAKEPQKRYASALALAEDLDRYLADTPIQARRVPAFERARKWVRRRPIRSFLLAFSALAVSIGLFTSVRSDARFRAARSQFQAELTRYENDLIAGRYPIQELSRLETSTEGDRRFADEHSRALYLLREAQNGREEQESSARARERLRRFLDLRDVALFQDTQLTGLDPSDSVAAVRESALAALRLFAADSPRANQWALAPFHSSLTEQDRDHVNRGCYEMLMVLAEAIAQPLPGESPAAQARQALEILDRAAILCREPTHAYHLKRAACLERAGDVDGAKRERTAADRIRPDGAFDHFLTGLEQYKHGHLAEAKRHFAAALQARANHFWAQCLLATCDLNNRHASADVAKAYLTTCVQTHPELPWLYLLRGCAWGELGSRAASASREAEAAENFAAAEADYAEALRRDPEGKFRYALLVDRGLVRFHSGKLAEAVADLEAAIALGPRQLSA